MTAKGATRIVSITAEIPYRGVDTGGGQYLFHHYKILAERCSELNVFACANGSNALAASYESDIGCESYRAVVSDIPKWRKRIAGRVVSRLLHIIFPTIPDLGVIASLYQSSEIRTQLANADIVELQFFEYFFFARLVRRINPIAVIIGVAHDIPSQRIERRWSSRPHILRRSYLAYVNFLERRMLVDMPILAAHSPKDAALLSQRSCQSQIQVLNPPLALDWPVSKGQDQDDGDDEGGNRAKSADRSFGFVSALHRPENDDAALWLLRAIWPIVVEWCPTAHLYVIGSKPSPALRDMARRFQDSVSVTGYVDDLRSFYGLFDTAVIPLRFGAGIKLKTVAAILAGKNIVATPIAVEGTLPDDYFFCVSESAEELASAMIELAMRPEIGGGIVERAREEAGCRYSRESFAQAMSQLYGISPDSPT